LHLTPRLDCLNLPLAHAREPRPLLGSIVEPSETSYVRLRLDPLRRQILFLRGNPIGNVELGQRLSLTHRVERRTHIESFQETVASRLHDRNIALVIGDAADCLHRRRESTLLDLR